MRKPNYTYCRSPEIPSYWSCIHQLSYLNLLKSHVLEFCSPTWPSANPMKSHVFFLILFHGKTTQLSHKITIFHGKASNLSHEIPICPSHWRHRRPVNEGAGLGTAWEPWRATNWCLSQSCFQWVDLRENLNRKPARFSHEDHGIFLYFSQQNQSIDVSIPNHHHIISGRSSGS